MTSQYDLDAFANSFDASVDEMHTSSFRGGQPSARVWATISEQIERPSRAETADPRAIGPDRDVVHATMERNNKMDAALSPHQGSYAERQPHRIGWMTVLAAGLVGLMIITSVWLNGGNVPPGRDDLAWAPGMGTPVASPAASPPAYTYGPEYACTVEPLTTEQVFDIVMNPGRELARRGFPGEMRFDDLEESDYQFYRNNIVVDNSSRYFISSDAQSKQPIIEAGNTFWNCLMTGTAFQVWSMMDPYAVQHEILLQYPVLRDEGILRTHIVEWGPRRYSAALYHVFPDLGGVDPTQAGRIVDESGGTIRVQANSEAYIGERTSDMDPIRAVVTMVPHPESGASDLDYVELYMRRAPDGTWWFSAIVFPENRGRG